MFNNGGNGRTPFVSCSALLAFLVPLVIGAYWPLYSVAPEVASILLRPAIVGASLALLVLWYSKPVSSAEIQAAGVLGLLCAALLVPSLTGTDPARSLAVWTKLLILCATALMLARALRDPIAARAMASGLILASAIVGAFTVVTYIRFEGFVLPTYKVAREFKGIAERTGIPLNAIPFTVVFSYLAGMSMRRPTRMLYLLGFGLFVISSALTGSRAPLVVLALSGCLLLLCNALRSRQMPIRYLAWLTLAAVPLGAAVLLTQVPFVRMSAMTEGRWDLWYVALRKFSDQPLLGSGFDSWHDDLASLLPGAYALTHYLKTEIIGGYHNEYLALLAEQGLFGFAAATVLVVFLFKACWKAAFRCWQTWHSRQWVLFTCIFLLLRACLEIPGLFGDGSEPADYLAYIFVAIVVSRFSAEQDFLAGPRVFESPLQRASELQPEASYS